MTDDLDLGKIMYELVFPHPAHLHWEHLTEYTQYTWQTAALEFIAFMQDWEKNNDSRD